MSWLGKIPVRCASVRVYTKVRILSVKHRDPALQPLARPLWGQVMRGERLVFFLLQGQHCTILPTGWGAPYCPLGGVHHTAHRAVCETAKHRWWTDIATGGESPPEGCLKHSICDLYLCTWVEQPTCITNNLPEMQSTWGTQAEQQDFWQYSKPVIDFTQNNDIGLACIIVSLVHHIIDLTAIHLLEGTVLPSPLYFVPQI